MRSGNANDNAFKLELIEVRCTPPQLDPHDADAFEHGGMHLDTSHLDTGSATAAGHQYQPRHDASASGGTAGSRHTLGAGGPYGAPQPRGSFDAGGAAGAPGHLSTSASGGAPGGGGFSYLDALIDLSPFINSSAFSVPDSHSLERTYILFRTMGLRHLTVVDQHHRVTGAPAAPDAA